VNAGWAPAGSGTVLTRGTVVIDVEACKGCDLCIAACPPGVLVMTTQEVNDRGYRYPRLLPGCTGCKACSQICPDFVFQVYKYETPVELTAAPRPSWVRS
jgi:2-oxoglutarate ferredoxin oxidoreductase subunit delta